MTVAETHLHRLYRLRRRLNDIRAEVQELHPEPSAWRRVKTFLRCWMYGHPPGARPGKACPRCGAWLPIDRKETLRRSAAGLAQIHAYELAQLSRAITRCDAGGYHAYTTGPCLKTADAARAYRDRLDAAGVRWLPLNDRAPTPIITPAPVPEEPRTATAPRTVPVPIGAFQ